MKTYQVVVLGENGSVAERFRHTLRRRFAELHIDAALLSLVTHVELDRLDPTSPMVGIFFGLKADDIEPSASSDVAKLLDNGHVVVPTVPDLEQYSRYVPENLRPINALLRSEDEDCEELCGIVLENLSLLRKSRRVFISYRRIESRSVAIQLYEELDSRTFDVFLDTHSILPGDEFQEVLWHRLADTDVMVLLDTPQFLGSEWTEAELARANSTSLQILQVVWPGHHQDANASFCVDFQLSEADFVDQHETRGENARLISSTVKKIAVQAESLRARALAARHAFLVREIQREATARGVHFVAQPGRYVELTDVNGSKAIMVPTVGVPDAVRFQEIEERMVEASGHELTLVFDERGVLKRWLKHIEWLEPAMRVRNVRIGKIHSWMAQRFAV